MIIKESINCLNTVSGVIGLSILLTSACAGPAPTPQQPAPVTSTPPAMTVNPVEDYARKVGLGDEYTLILKPLGDNEKVLDESDKKAVDLAFSISQMRINNSSKKANISYLASGGITEFDNSYSLLKLASDKSLERMLELEIDDNVIDYISFISSLSDRDFARYSLENALCIQDKMLTDLEMTFLKEPDRYKQQVFDYYLAEINKPNPELAMELPKLPEDLKTADIKRIEALEDIQGLSIKPEYENALNNILNTGIKGKRKYCSPLEAVAWIAYDKDFDKEYLNPFVDYSQEKLIRMAWMDSIESNNFKSDRWTFDEALYRFSSLELYSIFAQQNIAYKSFVNANASPKTIFESGGNCVAQSRLGAYILIESAGWEYDNFEQNKNNACCVLDIKFDKRIDDGSNGHAVFLYIKNGLFQYINVGGAISPLHFETIEDVGNHIAGSYGRNMTYYTISRP